MNKVKASLFLELLTVLFIGLKLTHHIDWDWWIVLAPLWLPMAGGLFLFVGAYILIRIGRA